VKDGTVCKWALTDVDKDALDLLLGEQELKRLLDGLGGGTTVGERTGFQNAGTTWKARKETPAELTLRRPTIRAHTR
jgi:hypothetical protein